jgi:hypothetical protein
MTLLLGGPGSSKSILLKALSGRLKGKNSQVGLQGQGSAGRGGKRVEGTGWKGQRGHSGEFGHSTMLHGPAPIWASAVEASAVL